MASVKEAVEIIDLTGDSASTLVAHEESASNFDQVILPTQEDGPPNQENDSVQANSNKNTTSSSSSKRKRRRRSEAVAKAQDVDSDQSANAEDNNLFFVDTAPIPLPNIPLQPEEQSKDENLPEDKLLLPAHVTVFGSAPIEILPPPTSLEDDSIQFLDYDDNKVFRRYWEDQEPIKNATRVVCKHCGAEGQHKTYECTVVICLTCGARDDHPTRSCPISKVCFSCGMKGHINATCPNRYGNGVRISSRFVDCERCSSTQHKTNECPTWWRMYAYLSDVAQVNVLALRREKRDCKLGEGGEGYIAEDQWCYSCGNSGHLGDDCPENSQFNQDHEHSAFSMYNVASGPFYDPEKEASNSKKAQSRPRPKESFMDLERVPDDVGRRGKEKAKSRLGKMTAKVDDDPDDWFSKASKPSDKSQSKKPKSIQFSDSLRNKKRGFDQINGTSKTSLLDRLGDSFFDEANGNDSQGGRGSKRSKKKKEKEGSDDYNSRRDSYRGSHRNGHQSNGNAKRDWDSDWDRTRGKDRDRDRGSHDNPHRPRYKGGYSR